MIATTPVWSWRRPFHRAVVVEVCRKSCADHIISGLGAASHIARHASFTLSCQHGSPVCSNPASAILSVGSLGQIAYPASASAASEAAMAARDCTAYQSLYRVGNSFQGV